MEEDPAGPGCADSNGTDCSASDGPMSIAGCAVLDGGKLKLVLNK